jgi:hypothetical protein
MPYKDPARQREYKRTWERERRAGEPGTPCGTRIPADFRLKTAADVVALLEEQVSAVVDDPQAGTLEKARCVGYLAGVSLKAIEAGDLAARLEALESSLKTRNRAT